MEQGKFTTLLKLAFFKVHEVTHPILVTTKEDDVGDFAVIFLDGNTWPVKLHTLLNFNLPVLVRLIFHQFNKDTFGQLECVF